MSSFALAQTPPAADGSDSQTPPELAEVRVTGSRIIREGYTTPTPVTTIDVAELNDGARPNIGDTLMQLPVFQGSLSNRNQTINNTQSARTALNLRNLGSNRTLVLFDGRRLPASNTENVANVGLMPDSLIRRVDVVTGGASAVYGSDAVSGVVNYILDTDFTGLKATFQGGISGAGDGVNNKISLTGGSTFFDDRLHLLVSGSRQDERAIHGGERSWNTVGRSAMQNPDYVRGGTAPQFIAQSCCVATTYPAGGLILSGPLKGTVFGMGGTVGQYDYGYGLSTPGNNHFGGSWEQSTMAGAADISVGDRSQHVFLRAGFDLTPSTEIFVQYIGGENHVTDSCCFAYYQTGIGTLFTSNPFIPASVLERAQADNVTSFPLGSSLRYPAEQFGPGNIGPSNYHYSNVYVVGMNGGFTLGKGAWNWNVYGQRGIAISDLNIAWNPIKDNLANAINAVRVGSFGPGYSAEQYTNPRGIAAGTITCASNLLPLTDPGATSDCVPYNIFGTGVASAAAIDYVHGTADLRQVNTQTIAGGAITGEPFDNWAGPVSVALSAEWRREEANGSNDPISADTGFFSTNFFPFIGTQSVKEVALETVVPLLKDKSWAQSLDFNGAVRATDYSTSGAVTTWKVGLEWTPIDDIRFRGTRSVDIRAPNLSDLFGYSYGHNTTVDPFWGNISAPTYTITAGNPDLDPEMARQTEIGVVLRPSFAPALHFSADWWRIEISDAISTVGSAFELQECYNSRIGDSFTGTSPYCSLITRNPDNTLDTVSVIPFNVASFLAQGIDYQADYRTRLDRFVSSWAGSVGLTLSVTQTQKLITDTGIPGPARVRDAAGAAASLTAGSGAPKWAALASVSYESDRWRFVWSQRYIGSVLASTNYIQCTTDCPTTIPSGFSTVGWDPRLPAYSISNVAVQYKLLPGDGGTSGQVFLSVDNVFDKAPPWSRATPGQLFGLATNPTLYDTVGTYIRAGVRFQF